MKYLKSYNESIRDKMTGVSDEDVIRGLSELHPYERVLKAIELGLNDEVIKTFNKHGGYTLFDVDMHKGRMLETAAYKNNTEIVKYLFSRGADPNVDEGRLIRYPIEYNNMEMLKLFLDNGYKLIDDFDGYNDALHVAKRDNKSQEMIDLIEEYTEKQKRK